MCLFHLRKGRMSRAQKVTTPQVKVTRIMTDRARIQTRVCLIDTHVCPFAASKGPLRNPGIHITSILAFSPSNSPDLQAPLTQTPG